MEQEEKTNNKRYNKEKDLVPVDSDYFRDRAVIVDGEILIRPKKVEYVNSICQNLIKDITTTINNVPIDHIREDGTQVTNYGGRIYQHSDGSWNNENEEETDLWKEIYEELQKENIQHNNILIESTHTTI